MSELSMSKLTQAYNEAAATLGKPLVRKFRTKGDAERRTKEILAELHKSKRKSTRKQINLPYLQGPTRPVRSGSHSDIFMDLLQRKGGATMAELTHAVMEHDARKGKQSPNAGSRARMILLGLHQQLGYGISQQGDQFFLITK